MGRFCQERKIFFLDGFELGRNADILGKLADSIDRSFTVSSLIHLINAFYAHCACDFTVFFTGAVCVVFHNDRKHHCAGNTVWCVINSTKCMSHGMSDSKTYVRESHTSDILSKSHSFTTFFCVFNSTAERFGDQLDCF